MNMLNGKKTWIGGLVLIVAGIARLVEWYQGGMSDTTALENAITSIGGGLGVIGIGHKLTKQDAAAEGPVTKAIAEADKKLSKG